MMNQKKIDLLKKLKNLAEQGAGGEKETAQKKLKQLITNMKRHIRKNKVIRTIKIIEIEATLLITEVIWLLLLFYCRAAGPLDIVWK